MISLSISWVTKSTNFHTTHCSYGHINMLIGAAFKFKKFTLALTKVLFSGGCTIYFITS